VIRILQQVADHVPGARATYHANHARILERLNRLDQANRDRQRTHGDGLSPWLNEVDSAHAGRAP